VWRLHLVAKEYNCRPSDLLYIKDPYAAYCLDTAVAEFGRTLENELQGVEGKTKKEITVKSQRILSKWLDLPMQYRDPMKSGHVQIPSRDEG
jgi:hypothetical protein